MTKTPEQYTNKLIDTYNKIDKVHSIQLAIINVRFTIELSNEFSFDFFRGYEFHEKVLTILESKL